VNKMVELFTTGPAHVLGFQSRGRLVSGGPADLTIFDMEHTWTYDVNLSYSKSRNSPFDGHVFRGGPIATIVSGEFAWRVQ
jgi:dihydroorotase